MVTLSPETPKAEPPAEPQPQMDNLFQPLLRQLAKHFVSVLIRDEDREPVPTPSYSRLQPISGFLVSVRGRWFIVTAGHVLQAIEEDIINKGREITRADAYVGWALEKKTDALI